MTDNHSNSKCPNPCASDSEVSLKLIFPSKVVAIYLLLSGVWIICSDHILQHLAPDATVLSHMQTAKGWLFILTTSLLLHVLIRRHFGEMDASRRALQQSYEGTLEGWVRALDLRDRETQGHTRRVTEMSLCLARKMGLPDTEIAHLQRGALLHDIGKMAVPDSILHKPGPLTEEQWVVMRCHPETALRMLEPIDYLRPALDIPYCHHERWDGTGYPRGLRGEEIPLAARIFSVVDVWDALSSDRPYRRAWSRSKVLDELVRQRGQRFDPQVVDTFLSILNRGCEKNRAEAVPCAIRNAGGDSSVSAGL